MSNIQKAVSTKEFFNQEKVKNKFEELLGSKAVGFVSSVLQVTANNKALANAEPSSVYASAMMAATLDLPINQNLGFAWIVPYNESFKDSTGQWQKKQVAQFQMGWKGFVQLAQRTGQYQSINVIEVFESQFESFNPLTEEIKADFTAKPDGLVVGYCGYFKLINGFTKTTYWTREQAEAHGKKYSKSFAQNSSPWNQHFDAMAKKTVLKNMLSKWGILSIEMQKAQEFDQASIIETEDEELIEANYIDAPSDEEQPEAVDAETFKQIIEGITKGTTTLEDVAQYYELSEDQKEELSKIKVKK